MNPDTARPTREPETEAGRALLRPEFDAYGLRGMVLAIEAELRASLAAKVRTLPGMSVGEGTYPEFVHRAAVLALIEDADPASPTGRETRMSASEDVERLERLALRTLHRRYLTTHDSAQRNAIWRDILAIDKMTMPPKTIRSLARLATDSTAPEQEGETDV